jgi:hypothetical protein
MPPDPKPTNVVAAAVPALGRVAFNVTNAEGESIGVYLELDAAMLRRESWKVELRGKQSSRPGVGNLVYTHDKQRQFIADGSVTARVVTANCLLEQSSVT